MNDPIYKVKKIELNELKGESPLDKWFYKMVNKRIDDLTIMDISRMLRQDIYIDIAIQSSWKLLLENPFIGEMYEGQLIELLTRSLEKHPEKKEDKICQLFLSNLSKKMNLHEWDDLNGKEMYIMQIEKLKNLFHNN